MVKKLKSNGKSIDEYQVTIEKFTDSQKNEEHERIALSIKAEGFYYNYKIYKDTREPDILFIINTLENNIKRAITEYLNIEISEYTDRQYLFIKFQDIGQTQYTGNRVK